MSPYAAVVSTDNLTPEQRKHTMSQLHDKDTQAEMQDKEIVQYPGSSQQRWVLLLDA